MKWEIIQHDNYIYIICRYLKKIVSIIFLLNLITDKYNTMYKSGHFFFRNNSLTICMIGARSTLAKSSFISGTEQEKKGIMNN